VKLTAQFIKYVTVAVLSAASDWVVFIAVMAWLGQPLPAYGTARVVGAVVSFFVNKHWSFESPDSGRTFIEGGRFLLLFAASYTLALTLFSVFTFGGLNPYWSKLLADTICFFVNFLMMRQWVYRHAENVDLDISAREKAGRAAG
jgi:putative flippase GtrA